MRRAAAPAAIAVPHFSGNSRRGRRRPEARGVETHACARAERRAFASRYSSFVLRGPRSAARSALSRVREECSAYHLYSPSRRAPAALPSSPDSRPACCYARAAARTPAAPAARRCAARYLHHQRRRSQPPPCPSPTARGRRARSGCIEQRLERTTGRCAQASASRALGTDPQANAVPVARGCAALIF